MKTVKLGTVDVGPGHPPYLIAEIGSNHNGDMDLCRQLIDAAAAAGARAVKFQSWTENSLIAKEEYDRNTGYPSGRRVETFESLNSRRPGEPLRMAVKRMLPKNNLGRRMILKLKLYAGTEHPHGAQQPKVYVPVGRGTQVRA